MGSTVSRPNSTSMLELERFAICLIDISLLEIYCQQIFSGPLFPAILIRFRHVAVSETEEEENARRGGRIRSGSYGCGVDIRSGNHAGSRRPRPALALGHRAIAGRAHSPTQS